MSNLRFMINHTWVEQYDRIEKCDFVVVHFQKCDVSGQSHDFTYEHQFRNTDVFERIQSQRDILENKTVDPKVEFLTQLNNEYLERG